MILKPKKNQKGTVGIGIPGAVSPQTGLVKNANSTWIIGRDFEHDLATALGREVRLANDANCLAVSESVDGAGAGAKVVFAIILGTGCGGGIAIDQKVHAGPLSIAGEWGHITLGWMSPEEYPGEECYCGKRGCLETFVSGTGFENEYERQTGNRISGHKIIKLLEEGDDTAEKVMRTYENRLARGIATLANFLDPDVLVLGGGMSNISRIYQNLPGPLLLTGYLGMSLLHQSGLQDMEIPVVSVVQHGFGNQLSLDCSAKKAKPKPRK
ncbi:MAG: hypothetical protein CM1200mP30_30840 [Pseudomonadota bacterium]|nr:MAG: hypothetical protein CM1200mP30_30840 [Pseudomonadota bacterium]